MFFKKLSKVKPSGREDERRLMVRNQLMARGIENRAVLESMLEVPRHFFVPPHLQDFAYLDGPLDIGEGQTISQPFIVAYMIELANPTPEGKFLEIGTGSGYAAAVLSRIVKEVYTVERIPSLAKQAVDRFKKLGYSNIRVRVGDGTLGWPEEAPFHGIIVSAGAPGVPQALCDQLCPGGRLVVPAGGKFQQDLLVVHRLADGSFLKENMGPVCFVPLIGKEGWVENGED